eukprot:TRINITY_DN1029_c0_g2_i1.p1 TRINITY_DN1029_c0_g2~~TRINITY_DN1029_c0_g2_i1.p1  ORF type:complete len:705 (+),score=123.00 TRINITY_DN1029_c0_g2_i1:562-2676(+)
MDQSDKPSDSLTQSNNQAQRDFLIQGSPKPADNAPSPPHSTGTQRQYQPMATYLGDLVNFLGNCDKQEQEQKYHRADNLSNADPGATNQECGTEDVQDKMMRMSGMSGIPQLDLDTIIKKQTEFHQTSKPVVSGTLSDVLQQIQDDQRRQEMQMETEDAQNLQNVHNVLSMDSMLGGSHHHSSQGGGGGGGYKVSASQQELQELGIQEYDYTQLDYSNGGRNKEEQEIRNGGGLQIKQHQELKLQYLNQHKPQNHMHRGSGHAVLQAWHPGRGHELQGGTHNEEGQMDSTDNYGMYEGLPLSGADMDTPFPQTFPFCDNIDTVKNQFFQETGRIKDLLYYVRGHLSGDHWQKVGEAGLAVDGLGFAFSSTTHALAQEQLRTNQLQEQLSLTWQHVQRLRQEAVDLWTRQKANEGSYQEEAEGLRQELQGKREEVENLLQVQERLQKENLTLKRELVRQVEQQNSGYVNIVSERNALKDRLQQIIHDLKLQRSHNREMERVLAAKGISLPSVNNIRFPQWDTSASSSNNVLNTLRQQAQLVKQQQQLQQQFLQRKVSPTNPTPTPTSTQSQEPAQSSEPPSHVKAPAPPEALDSPSDYPGGNSRYMQNGVIPGDYGESDGSGEQEDMDEEEEEGEEEGREEAQEGALEANDFLELIQGQKEVPNVLTTTNIQGEDDKGLNPNLSPFAMPFVPTQGSQSPPSAASL